MDFPTLAVQAAWGNNPFDSSPTWTVVDGNRAGADLTPRLLKASIRHQRQHTLAQFERAVGDFEFWNDDRRVDPNYTGGPYGSNVKPRKPFRLRATYAGVTYDIFRGFTGSIRPVWIDSKAERHALIQVADAFKLFQRRKLKLGQWPTLIPKYNPRAWYQMNDANGATVMKDSAPTPHDGTYTGRNKVTDVGAITTDPADAALKCGTNQGAAAGPTAAGLDNVTETPAWVGVMRWINISAWPSSGNSYTLYDQIVDGAGGHFAVRITDAGKVRLNLLASTYDSGMKVPADGLWHLVSVMHYGGTLRISVDDADPTQFLVAPVTMTQAAPHFGELTDGTLAFTGSMDEAVTFVGSLPQIDDIKAMYRDIPPLALGIPAAADNRIWNLLDMMGWPAGDRYVANNAVHDVQPIGAIDSTYLAYMQDLIATEGGLMFMRGDGKLYFDKEQPTSAPASTVTFGQGVGEIHYRSAPEVELTDESQMLINEVHLQSPGLADAYAIDQPSIDAYGPSGNPGSGTLLFTTLGELQDRTSAIKTRFKDPKLRVASVTLDAADDPTNTIPVMLGLALGATVTVKTPDGDSIASQVTGRNHDIDMAGPTWRTTFALEPW